MRTYSVGRRPGKTFYFHNPEVSQDHAEIVENDGNYTLIDHSMNGTTVNGNRVHNSSYPLHRGDTVLFAGREMLDWNLIGIIGPGPEFPKPNAPFSVASMVCGIVSLVIPYFALPLAIVGLCLGVSGTRKIKGQENRYKGLKMLKAGKVCSIVSLGLWGLLLILGLIGVASLGFYDLFNV